MEDHLNRSLTLWVYNSEFDVVREVELVPTRGWGGEGALGAVLGYGALHRLPVGLGEEVEGPGEVVFETKDNGLYQRPESPAVGAVGGNFLVSATIATAPPLRSATPTSGKSKAGRRHRHAAISPNQAFDEYFAEGEQKSKEQDYVPSRNSTPLPPPPKLGGPPRSSASPAPAASEPQQTPQA